MEKIVEQGILFDFYGELLTKHQKEVYQQVVFNDLSLSEIAEEMGTTRQAAHDLMKRCDKILMEYEKKLSLVEKFSRTKNKIVHIDLLLKETEELVNNRNAEKNDQEISDKIVKIREITNSLIEEL